MPKLRRRPLLFSWLLRPRLAVPPAPWTPVTAEMLEDAGLRRFVEGCLLDTPSLRTPVPPNFHGLLLPGGR